MQYSLINVNISNEEYVRVFLKKPFSIQAYYNMI
jgi:hypothetical protein